jgi:hypothetical protein
MTHLNRFATKIVGVFFALLLLSGCDNEDETVDITVLPAETTVGANTFGCLMDGWVYVGGRYRQWSYGGYEPSIEFTCYPQKDSMSVRALVKPNITIYFAIQPIKEGETAITNIYWENETRYRDERLPDGVAVITRFDPVKQIISGRFEGGRIEQGRFDVQYSIVNNAPY